jgi:bis(5'-adenosyl)-triphosphatase
VVPHRIVPRLTDLTKTEIGDVFETVQTVERMLAKVYFRSSSDLTETNSTTQTVQGKPYDGSFNIAVQDGPDAGQSVVHVHCHIIPRVKGNIQGDGIYDMLASDEGNIGGHLWDRDRRPTPNGTFPKIEDENRKPRTMEEMKKEAVFFRREMEKLQSI